MNFNSKLSDFICVNPGVISSKECDSLINAIDDRQWFEHTWYNAEKNISFSCEDKEPSVQAATPDWEQTLFDHINNTIKLYHKKYFYPGIGPITKFSDPRFNRYEVGQLMRQHCDHIKDIFDGTERGIPVLSVIISLNDEYKGGELYFWEDHKVPLGKGDIVIFPSTFLFPHGVMEVTEGIRYSVVSWVW